MRKAGLTIPLVLLAIIILLSAGCLSNPIGRHNVTITTNNLPEWYAGQPGAFQMEAVKGVPPYNWSVKPGSTIPDGFNLSADGILSGTPGTLPDSVTYIVTDSFTIRVTDSDTPPSSDEKSYSVLVGNRNGIPPTLASAGSDCGNGYQQSGTTQGHCCPLSHQYWYSGSCHACADGYTPRGSEDHCCPTSSAYYYNGECHECPEEQPYAYNKTCNQCPEGTGIWRDRTSGESISEGHCCPKDQPYYWDNACQGCREGYKKTDTSEGHCCLEGYPYYANGQCSNKPASQSGNTGYTQGTSGGTTVAAGSGSGSNEYSISVIYGGHKSYAGFWETGSSDGSLKGTSSDIFPVTNAKNSIYLQLGWDSEYDPVTGNGVYVPITVQILKNGGVVKEGSSQNAYDGPIILELNI